MHSAVSQTAAGQKLDCAWGENDLTTIEEYERIVSYKTGPLLSLPLESELDGVGSRSGRPEADRF